MGIVYSLKDLAMSIGPESWLPHKGRAQNGFTCCTEHSTSSANPLSEP